jgi:hypothetical protein
MDWIAIVSVLVSGAVGVAGVRAGMVSAREARQSAERMAGEEREHLERMARIERVQPRRAETYLELLALLNHVMEIVDRTQPIIEPMPAPPDPPDEERLRMNQARIGAFGSPEVKEILRRWAQKRVEFFIDADMLRRDRERPGGRSTDETEWWRKVHAKREELRELARELEDRVNAELAE